MSNGLPVRRSMQASGAAVVRADGSYIVTGGLGGLGMVVTRWLVQRGAGRLVLNGRTEPSEQSAKRPCRPGEQCRNRLCARRYRFTGSRGAAGGGCRGDRTTVAGSRARGGRERRRRGGGAYPGRSGTSVGAQGGRRLAAARSDGDPTARLVGGLLFDGFASGSAGSNGVRKRERVARRPGGVATRIGSARNHDQLGPVVGRRDEPLADVQRSGPDHSCRRHRGVGVAGGWQPHSGGCRTAAPRSRRRRHPRVPRTRLLRKGARGVRHGERRRPIDRRRRGSIRSARSGLVADTRRGQAQQTRDRAPGYPGP